MKWILFVLPLLTALQSEPALAFKGSRCARLFDGGSYMGKNERMWLKMFLASTSTSQFFTSTGKCRMIGGISKDERKFFVADNAERIKKDIVHANGDYLAATAFLYNCDERSYDQMALRLQQNVIKIFGRNLNYNSTKISTELDSLMESDTTLKQICSTQKT